MRDIGTDNRVALEGPRSGEAILVFLTIEHDELDAPIRVVNDIATQNGEAATYIHNGHVFTAFPFELELLTDSEAAPTGRISVQNVDRSIGEAVQAISGAPDVTIELVPASEFDLTVNPRVASGGSPTEVTAIYTARGLSLRNVSVDAMFVSGELVSLDDAREPWPYLRATQALLPGLYR